jgi:hypothetical protein
VGNNLSKNELVGYWIIESAPESSPEGAGEIYLRFTENGLLQWGYENQWRICVISYDYWIEKESIGTVCLPNPRKEFTPYSISEDGKLKLAYSNYDTVWVKTNKQEFFESKNIWNPGIPFDIQEDYMSLLNSPPHERQIKRADYLGVSPQILVNTNVLWKVWEYSRSAFASFHFEDFKYILEQGVLIDDKNNLDDTLLIHLAADDYTEAVKLMLDNGADINHKDISGNTALDFAIFANRIDTIKLLKERGALSGSELEFN